MPESKVYIIKCVGKNSNVGIAARNIAGKLPSLDVNKAYIVGILHDIGRRVGIVNIPKHVYEGYLYCMDKGWEEAAKICMTHSYVCMKDEFDYGLWEIAKEWLLW